MKIFLDDERLPARPEQWVIVRSSEMAIRLCSIIGLGQIDMISFDHDLGAQDRAIDFTHWLINMDMDGHLGRLPDDFQFRVHSKNPVGAENIRGLLRNYFLVMRNQTLTED